ncbi:MAG: GDP-mannose 4,6-dehydratase [Candidatus Eisenbacteria bacterium]|nr:GDP-mannose 4,6-dehydratase [Candidatus Eisenbacteria bacterium]
MKERDGRVPARALVTGAAGFIGSHLAEALVRGGWTVTGIDSFTDYYDPLRKEKNVASLLRSDRFRLFREDLLDADTDRLLEGIDVVFHQAAQAGVRASWGTEFDRYVTANILATQKLLEAARRFPLRRFVFASSSSVYGNAEELPVREDSVKRPHSPYGVTKLAAEHLGHLYRMNHGVPFTALRYFTVIGPRQRPDMALFRLLRAAYGGDPLPLYGGGGQTRDFTYVSDIVDANLAAAEREAPRGAYNLGGGERVSMNRLIEIVAQTTGREVPVLRSDWQKGDVRDTWADCSAAREDLGFVPRVSLQEGVEKTAAWYREGPGAGG